MARSWKRAVELALAHSGAIRLALGKSRGRTTILAYHNVVPRGETAAGDVSLHVDQSVFADQLDFILDRHDIVALDAALESGGAASDRPRVAITFDDAYQGAMTAGVEELRKRGLTATVFVPPGLLGMSGFWWDVLSLGAQPLSPSVRRYALSQLAGRGEAILEWARSEGLPTASMPQHAQPCDEASLAPVEVGAGVVLGAHTWSHPNLVALESSEIEDELRRCRQWLTNSGSRWIDALTYPYGLHDSKVVEIATRHHQSALLIDGGAAGHRGKLLGQPHVTPRLNIPRGLSLEGLGLRLGGLIT